MQAVRALPPGPTVTARAIHVVHTAIFDAWAAYDARARGTRLGTQLRRPAAERTAANKNKAISFAAYTALADLFPARRFDFAEQMRPSSATGRWLRHLDSRSAVGNTAAQAVLDYRHADGSNQLNGYADTTGYQPVNSGDTIVDPWRWQPLRVPLGVGPEQRATTPQWSKVKGFALKSPNQFTTPGPDRLQSGFDPKHIDNLLALTSNLSDRQKVTAEYWADGPRSEFPPGHWALIAQVLSRKRGHTLDTDAKLFFALGNALMDASIAAWAAKYNWDFVRPITAIRHRYTGKPVTSWLGPYQGYGTVPGEQWIPYQSPNVVTPPFPEYVSGHSTFSSAAAAILAKFTGSDSLRRRRHHHRGHLAVRAQDRHPGGHPGHRRHPVLADPDRGGQGRRAVAPAGRYPLPGRRRARLQPRPARRHQRPRPDHGLCQRHHHRIVREAAGAN